MISTSRDSAQRFWTQDQRVAIVDGLAVHLWTYLKSHARPAERRAVLAGLLKMPPADLDRLIAQRVCSHPNVREFVEVTVPSLIRRFSVSTAVTVDTGLGRIRGRIDWQRTLAVRAAGGGPADYVWRPAERLYDLPENRLFKFALTQIRHLARIASGGTSARTPTSRTWQEHAAQLAGTSEAYLGHVLLKGVSDVVAVDDRAWQRAEGHRNELYRSAARFLAWLTEVQLHGGDLNRELLASTFLLPLTEDTLFELFVLTKLLDAMTEEGWTLRTLRVVAGGSMPVFGFSRGEHERSMIYYQHTIQQLVEVSRYLAMFRHTGLPAGVRRPDILVLMNRDHREWIGLVEVKRSRSKSYIADGIYKCLGYLKDFEAVLVEAQPAPRALLVVWGGVPTRGIDPAADVNVLTANRLAQGMRPFLHAARAALAEGH